MFTTPARRYLLVVAALAAPTLLVACGDDGGDSTEAAASAAPASSENDSGGGDGSYDVGTVAGCLSDAGFEVTREADQDPAFILPQEYKDSVGLIENLQLGFVADAKGTGSVGFFENVGSALDEYDAASGFRSEETLAGTSGTVNWDYIVTSGDDPGVTDLIQGCLS